MIEAVRERARPYFEDASPAHDWHHVRRVESLAETLVERHPDSVDERIVTLAVLLHDIGREREARDEIDDHAVWGSAQARRLLRDLEADEETISQVYHCVRCHRYSNDVDPETLEAKVVCDADNLDALGAVGIGRAFAHGGDHDVAMYDPDSPPSADESAAGTSQYNHLHKKILDLPDRMYTEAGAELATDRAAFVREFVTQFDAEVAGRR